MHIYICEKLFTQNTIFELGIDIATVNISQHCTVTSTVSPTTLSILVNIVLSHNTINISQHCTVSPTTLSILVNIVLSVPQHYQY